MLDDITIFADRPIHIVANPNAASLSADHFHGNDLYLSPQVTTESSILIDGDAGLDRFTLTGRLALVGGKNGIVALSGGSTVAQGVSIGAFRFEQPSVNTGWALDWQMPTNQLHLKGSALGGVTAPTNGGARLRSVTHTTFDNVMYTGTAATVALDMDSTCRDIRFIQTFFQDSSTVSMSGFEELEGYAGGNSLAPIKPNSFWFLTAFGSPIVYQNGQPTHKTKITLGVGATFQLTMSSVKTARLRVSAYSATGPTRACGSFHIDGTGSAVETDVHGNLAATNIGSKFCTIWSSSSNIALINNLAQSVTVLILEEWAT